MSTLLSFNNTILTVGGGSVALSVPVDPLNPLGLPPYTLRLRFTDGVTPTFTNGTAVQVSSSTNNNVLDLTYQDPNWGNLLKDQTDLIEVLGANSANVTSMGALVRGCSGLTDVALFDTSSVTNMGSMFRDCSSLSGIPQFDFSNVTSAAYMFYGCSSIVTLPAIDMPSYSSAYTAWYMFNGCTSLTSIASLDLGQCKHYNWMFRNCSSLTSAGFPSLDTSNAEDMFEMFRGCTSLTTAPSLNTHNAIRLDGMFRDCTALQAVPLYDLSSLTRTAAEEGMLWGMNNMFDGCTNVESGALALYQSASASPAVKYHSWTFRNCGSNTTTGAAELAQIPSNWGGTGT